MKILLKRFHLNGNTRGFHPQTQKLELCTKQIVPSATTAEEASFEWSNHRISSSQTQKLQKHYKSPRVKKFICDNEWFNTFSLWWKSLSTTISRFFAFKRPAYLKLNQNKSSLRFFLISPWMKLHVEPKKKRSHSNFFPRSRLRQVDLLRGKICQSQSQSTDWLASC